MVQNKSQLSAACQMVMDKYAPSNTTTAYASARRCGRAGPRGDAQRLDEAGRIQAGQDRGHTQRTGKPLNILMR